MTSLRTVWLYIGRQFLIWFAVAYCGFLVLVTIIDLIGLLGDAAGRANVAAGSVLAMAFLRLPYFSQELAPFAVLVGAIMTFVQLTRSHEMVIFRSAGISVWQFLFPALVAAALIGIVKITLLNPMGAFTLTKFEELEGRYLTGRSSLLALSPGGALWLRQVDENGDQAVIYADAVKPERLELQQIEVTLLDPDNRFVGRIDAERGMLTPGAWRLEEVWVSEINRIPAFHESFALSTDLTLEKVHESFASPETVSFWELPAFITALEATGFSAVGHRLQWNALLAEPFLLLAMVLIAASVSLRFTRRGGGVWLIASAILAGFGVFIFTEIIHALGLGATIPITLAAWTPAGVALMLGVSVVLHQEDG